MVTRINPNKVSVRPLTWAELKADAERDMLTRNAARLAAEGRSTPPAGMKVS